MIGRAIEIAKNEGFLALINNIKDFVKSKLWEQYYRLVIPYASRKIKYELWIN
ncbi:MAG: hypothetical protein J7K33_01290 [Candidatus Marinimicrobia bacterium]|nr:hypothetical protein [Candidatus Neomarinimicrobiota bacterium]